MSRKKLPPSTKARFVELLHDIRGHILPKEELSAEQNLQTATPDMRMITYFLRMLATRGSGSESSGGGGGCDEGRQAASSSWCDVADESGDGGRLSSEAPCGSSSDSVATSEVGTQTDFANEVGEYRMRGHAQATQTQSDTENTVVIYGWVQLLEVVEQTAREVVEQTARSVVSQGALDVDRGLVETVGSFMNSYVSISAGSEIDERLENDMAEMLSRFRATTSELEDVMHGMIAVLAPRVGATGAILAEAVLHRGDEVEGRWDVA